MYCVSVCVLLVIFGNVQGFPQEGNRPSLEQLLSDYYGPPPNVHVSSSTMEPPIPQQAIDDIFGTQPTIIKSKEELLAELFGSPSKPEINQQNNTQDIDADIIKNLWPDAPAPPPSPENVEPEDSDYDPMPPDYNVDYPDYYTTDNDTDSDYDPLNPPPMDTGFPNSENSTTNGTDQIDWPTLDYPDPEVFATSNGTEWNGGSPPPPPPEFITLPDSKEPTSNNPGTTVINKEEQFTSSGKNSTSSEEDNEPNDSSKCILSTIVIVTELILVVVFYPS